MYSTMLRAGWLLFQLCTAEDSLIITGGEYVTARVYMCYYCNTELCHQVEAPPFCFGLLRIGSAMSFSSLSYPGWTSLRTDSQRLSSVTRWCRLSCRLLFMYEGKGSAVETWHCMVDVIKLQNKPAVWKSHFILSVYSLTLLPGAYANGYPCQPLPAYTNAHYKWRPNIILRTSSLQPADPYYRPDRIAFCTFSPREPA